ncbi:hypothetical protein DI270_016290, partial [Microbispora triticiradicis]
MNPAALFAGGLVAGLAAGTASCAAVQGGLLIGLVSPGSPGATGAAGTTGAARATRDVRDALPAVAAFLTGRLAAHTALGALLGLAGSAVRLGPQTRAALLVAAGIAVTALAVRMLARRGQAGCAAAPPGHLGCSDGDTQDRQDTAHASTTHTSTVQASTAHASTARAAGLGLATILMPCGVTVSLEVVAVSAGSAPGGAAVLAGLALGTAPALAALGLLLRGLATTRLA